MWQTNIKRTVYDHFAIVACFSKSIQEDDGKGHSSVEDATATMELVLLKLKNGEEQYTIASVHFLRYFI